VDPIIDPLAISGCGGWVKIKEFWFFEPDEKTCRQVAARKRGMSSRLIRSRQGSAPPFIA